MTADHHDASETTTQSTPTPHHSTLRSSAFPCAGLGTYRDKLGAKDRPLPLKLPLHPVSPSPSKLPQNSSPGEEPNVPG